MSYVTGPGVQHWHSIDTMSRPPIDMLAPPSSAAWPTADLAIYVPIVVEQRAVVKQLWYGNGTTATGNYDIGLYDAGGTRLLGLGSTAKTTTSGIIVWNCTDTTVGPGIYYLALVSSTNSDTFFRFSVTAPIGTAAGMLTQASALPLPTTATFAITQTLAVCPAIGMFLDTRVT